MLNPGGFMQGVRRALILASLLTLALALPAVARAGNATVRVAYTEWFPYTYSDDGQARGFEIDILTAVLGRMGLTPTFGAFPWKRCLAHLESGKTDLVVSMLKAPEREPYTIFPEEPISLSRTVFAARTDRVPAYAGDLEALRGLRIGVFLGFTYGPAFDAAEFLEKDPAVDTATLIEKLMARRDDLIAENQVVIKALARRMGVLDRLAFLAPPIHHQRLYVGFSRARGLEGLAGDFSRALKAFKESGQYRAVLARYGLAPEEMTETETEARRAR
jgi:polar amino acid transport system substrate-binding protein